MSNYKQNLFFEKRLVWKKGHEVTSQLERAAARREDGLAAQRLFAVRASYTELYQYLRDNHNVLAARISERIAADPKNEYYPKVRKMLDRVVTASEFNPANISRENLELVRRSVISGDLEFFQRELAVMACAVIIEDISESLGEVGTAYAMEQPGTSRTVEIHVMVTPQIETVYDPKTQTTEIKMVNPETGEVFFKKTYKHPLVNNNPHLGSATSTEAGSVREIADGVHVMTTPAIEEVYDPKSNTITLKFSNPLGGKPFWVKKLEVVQAQ